MATVTERWLARKLSKTAGGWRFVRIFDVTGVDTEDEAIAAVESNDATTAHNASPDVSPLLYVADRDGEQAGFRFWTVTVTYSSSPEGRFFDHGNPLDEPTKWRVVPSCQQTASSVDAHGVEVVNTAGQAFSTDPPAFERFITLVAERVEPYFNLQQAMQFTNAVNDAAITFDGTWTLNKGQMCCRSIVPVSTITGAEPYVIVQYVIELREGGEEPDVDGYHDGFKVRVLNEGTEGFYDDDGVTVKGPLCWLVTENGKTTAEKVSYPVRLDDEGKPMLSEVKVKCPPSVNANGYADPVANDVLIYAGSAEFTGQAWFITIFPKGTQFRNFADLGL